MFRLRLFLILLLGAGSFISARAQAGVYGMFSAGHYSGIGVGNGTPANASGGITSLGGTFGVYDDALHGPFINVGGDARIIVENSANSTTYGNKIAGGLVGVRIDGSTIILPLHPYGQFEVGGIATNSGTGTSKTTSFAYQFQGGADFTVAPHVAVRGEYGLGQLSTAGSTRHTLQTFSVGLVLRLF